MAEKTIRVDETVHQALERKKQKRGEESFNEVLKHELGLIPGPDELQRLTASLRSEELQDTAVQVVTTIRDFGCGSEERVEELEHGEGFKLVFRDPASGLDLAYMEFKQNRFDYYYLNTNQKWEQAAAGRYNHRDGDVKYGDSGSGTYAHVEVADVQNVVEDTLREAKQRWC